MSKETIFKKELSYISSERIRKSCVEMIKILPDYFFEIEASSTGKYHPNYALGVGGLVRHTKAAVRIAYELLGDACIGEKYTQDEKDLMLMGLLLHDGLKSGNPKEKYTRFDHPLLVSKLIMEHASELKMDIDDVRKMCSLIESHMGKWNTNKYSKEELPIPNNELERFVHRCDYLASRNYLNVKFIKLDIE